VWKTTYLYKQIKLNVGTGIIFFILAHTVYKMWIIREPNTLELWNKLYFEEKNEKYIPRLKYSVPIFVE